MQIITPGFVLLSLILVASGMLLGWLFGEYVIPANAFDSLRESDQKIVVLVFGIGLPLAVANVLEVKYIWSRVFGRPKLDLLGISLGIVIGISSHAL